MISCFPDPYPDEILYSVCARYSDRLQYPERKSILYELFGYKDTRLSVDLPCRIGHLVKNLFVKRIYTADILIDQHTLLPYYAPFISQERFSRIRELMVGGNGKALHRVVGISSTQNISSPLWIRYCPLCVQQDRMNCGEAYWHRLHQVPGVEICPIHTIFLENSTIIRTTASGPRDLISAECALENTNSMPRLATSSPTYNALISIALDTRYLLEHPSTPPPSHFFRSQYSTLLRNQGFLTEGDTIRALDLLNAFNSYYSLEFLTSLQCEVNFACKPSNSWLIRLRVSRRTHHPLHHLLAIRFLGTNLETFFSQEFKPTAVFGDGPWSCLNPVCQHYQQNHILNCQSYEQSKGYFIGKFSCDSCGFSYSQYHFSNLSKSNDTSPRSKVLSYGEVWEQKFQEMWLDPTISLGKMSRCLGVVPGTLKKQAIRLQLPFPRSFPGSGMVKPRRNPAQKKECSWYRSQWLTILKNAPEDAGMNWFRHKVPGIYEWLRQNDNVWLNIHRPSRKHSSREIRQRNLDVQSANEETLRETEENLDRNISSKVLAAAHKLIAAVDPLKRVTFNKIALDVPDIIGLRRHPDKYPLTAQTLQEVTETWEEFAIRRIWWATHKFQEEQVYPTQLAFVMKAGVRKLIRCKPSIRQAVAEAMNYLLQLNE